MNQPFTFPSIQNANANRKSNPAINKNSAFQGGSAFTSNNPFQTSHQNSSFAAYQQNGVNSASTNTSYPNNAMQNFNAPNGFQNHSNSAFSQIPSQSANSAFSAIPSGFLPPQTTPIVRKDKKEKKRKEKRDKKEMKTNVNTKEKEKEPNAFNEFGNNRNRQNSSLDLDKDLEREKRKMLLKAKLKGKMKNSGNLPPMPNFTDGRFNPQNNYVSDDLSVLNKLPQPITKVISQQDKFDFQNQKELASIEENYLRGNQALQTVYETMNAMRETERREMEERHLVDSSAVRKNLDEAIVFQGTCQQMCPIFERVRRAYENNVLSLEKDPSGHVTPELAVKAFSRPAAGQPPPLPSDVRPPDVLVNTLKYIVLNIVPKLPQSHPFLWDRTRSIRQDFTYQNFQGPEALQSFEIISRIHIVCLHRMAKAAVENGFDWSQQQELEQFSKCLQSLAEFYSHSKSENEAEMRAYQLLLQLFDPEMASTVDRLSKDIRNHPLVRLAFELRSLTNLGLPMLINRIKKSDVPITFKVLLEVHCNNLRKMAFRALVQSVHKRTSMYPLTRLTKILGFEDINLCRNFCDYYDIIININDESLEEVDVSSWDEANVRDKLPMPQSYNKALDYEVELFDVTKPVQISSSTTRRKYDFTANFERKSNATQSTSSTVPMFKPPSQSNVMPVISSGLSNEFKATQSSIPKPKADFNGWIPADSKSTTPITNPLSNNELNTQNSSINFTANKDTSGSVDGDRSRKRSINVASNSIPQPAVILQHSTTLKDTTETAGSLNFSAFSGQGNTKSDTKLLTTKLQPAPLFERNELFNTSAPKTVVNKSDTVNSEEKFTPKNSTFNTTHDTDRANRILTRNSFIDKVCNSICSNILEDTTNAIVQSAVDKIIAYKDMLREKEIAERAYQEKVERDMAAKKAKKLQELDILKSGLKRPVSSRAMALEDLISYQTDTEYPTEETSVTPSLSEEGYKSKTNASEEINKPQFDVNSLRPVLLKAYSRGLKKIQLCPKTNQDSVLFGNLLGDIDLGNGRMWEFTSEYCDVALLGLGAISDSPVTYEVDKFDLNSICDSIEKVTNRFLNWQVDRLSQLMPAKRVKRARKQGTDTTSMMSIDTFSDISGTDSEINMKQKLRQLIEETKSL